MPTILEPSVSRPDRDRFRIRRRTSRIFLYGFLIFFALLQLFPLLWLLDYSLVRNSELFGPELLRWPSPFQWNNYYRALTDGRIPLYFWNSTLVVSVSVVGATLFSFFIAYACTRMTWKLRKLVYGFVMLGMIIPIHTTLLPNFVWFNLFGLLDSRIGLTLPYIAFNMAFNTMMFAGMLSSFPRSVEESAYMEGANITVLLSRIVAPMTKPAFATVSIMTFLNCWNEFIMANVFLATEIKRTLPFSVIRFQGQYAADYAVQFACMALVAVIPIILYFLFSKWIVAGVTAGAVKG